MAGEVEVVFGLWLGVLLIGTTLVEETGYVTQWLNGGLADFRIDFTEPMFALAIMTIAAPCPIIDLAT